AGGPADVAEALEHLAGGAPQAVGILLGPAWVGVREAVARLRDAEHAAVLARDRDALHGACPHVEADDRGTERAHAAEANISVHRCAARMCTGRGGGDGRAR